jgi:hypothetical protein
MTAPAPNPAGESLDVEVLAREIEVIANAWKGANGGIYTIRAMSLKMARTFAPRFSALQRQVEEAERERDEADKWIHEATKAITGLTAGGSEYFGRRVRNVYRADLEFCVQRIRERFENGHRLACEAVRERKAAESRLAARDEELKLAREALERIALLDEADGHELTAVHALQAVGIASHALGKYPSEIALARLSSEQGGGDV